jgi:hypothetical protein
MPVGTTQCPLCGEAVPHLRQLGNHLATPAGEGCPYTPLGPDDQLTGCEGVVQSDEQTNEIDSSPPLDSVSDHTETATNDGRKPSQNARLGVFDTRDASLSPVAKNGGVTNE